MNLIHHALGKARLFGMFALAAAAFAALMLVSASPAKAGAPPNRLDDNRSAGYSLALQATLDAILPVCPPVACTVNIGGRVIPHPKIVTMYWDDNWNAHNPNSPTRATIDDFVSRIGGSSYLDRANQYGVQRAAFNSDHTDTTCGGRPTGAVDFGNLTSWVTCEVQTPGTGVPLPDDNTVYSVFLPEGVTVTGVISATCQPGQSAAFHAWSAAVVPNPQIYNPLQVEIEGYPYILVPAQCALAGSPAATLDNFTEYWTHELAEATLDPFAPTGWIDNSQCCNIQQWTSVGEPADICQNVPGMSEVPTPPVRGSAGFMVSTYWSNLDNACVGGPIADLGVSKTGPAGPVMAGTSVLYSLTVSNAGPDDVTDAIVTDTLPPGTTFGAATANCTAAGQTVTCDVGALVAGASTSFDIQVLIASNAVVNTGGLGSITDTATVGGPAGSGVLDLNPANNSSSVTTLVEDSSDLRVSKLCKPDGQVLAGQPATCTIFVDNLGPSDARNVAVLDTMVSNGAFTINSVSASQGSCATPPTMGPVSCSLGNLTAGSSGVPGRATVTVVVSATEAVDINDVATATSDTPDPDSSNNQALGSVSVEAVADLGLTMTDSPDPVTAGTSITYTLGVTNNGPSTAQNVSVQDPLPYGVSVISVTGTGGASCGFGVPGDSTQPTTCNFGAMPPGSAQSMSLVVNVNPGVLPVVHNSATVSSPTLDLNNSNNIASQDTTVNVADLMITNSTSQDIYKPSSTIQWIVTVTNLGPNNAVGVVVHDLLPATKNVTYLFDTAGCSKNLNTLTCPLGTVAAGQTVSFSIYVKVKGNLGTVTNRCTVTSPTFDPVLTNNSSMKSVLIQGGA